MLGLAAAGHLSLVPLAVSQASAHAVLAFLIHRWHEVLVDHPLRPGRFGLAEVKSSSVYAVGLSAISVQNSYDQVVMKNSHSATDAVPGQYAAAYRMVSLGLMPMTAIAAATHTDFLDAGEGRTDQVARSAKFAKLGAAYSILFCIGAFLAAPLVPKLFGSDFEGTENMIRLLAPLVPLRGIGTFPMNGLLGLVATLCEPRSWSGARS
ncbi:MAG: hypothetical protein R2715_20700 [Ilumatobacteraceae bacterium]